MSAEREELRQLIEQLPDAELPGALADLRRHAAVRRAGAWPPPWFGAAKGKRHDAARRADELLAEGFGQTG